MRKLPSRLICGLGIASLGCLVSNSARAVPITDFVAVQPIDVCTGAVGTTTGCAPLNNKGQNYKTAAVGAIGFIDAATGINITNAIWNQIGLNVAFLPAVQDANAGGSQLIQVASCAANGTDCASPQFQTISDQASISMGGEPAPAPPLSPNPTSINMFFTTKLNPPSTQPGTLFGLAWVDNNGVAIAANTLQGVGPRVDTLAHEIGHDLDLDHATFGAGAPNNLMTAGSTRTQPTSTANALIQLGMGLGTGTADQLLASQQAQVQLSGFISPVPNVGTQITDPVGVGDFSVSFQNLGRPNEALSSLTLSAPAGSFIEEGSFQGLNLDGDTAGIIATPSYLDCTASPGSAIACQALTIAFGGTPFVLGDNFDYTVQVCELVGAGCRAIPLSDLVAALTGGTYTFQFSDGYQTTSILQPSSDSVLAADSWDPDPAISPEIYDQALLMAADAGQLPCTPTDGVCPPLELADASPIDEGTLVPEPPSILMLCAALLVLPAARRFWAPAGRYSKPALRSPSRM